MQKPEKFSISRIHCFESCMWRYKLQHVDKVQIREIAPVPSANFGSLIHHCAEFGIFDIEQAKKLAETKYAPITSQDLNENLVPNLMTVKNYIGSINCKFPNPPLNEKYLNWEGENFNLVAKVDRICKQDHTFKIVDYKTGKNIDKIEGCKEQLMFYHMMSLFWIKSILKIATIDQLTCELFFTRHDKAVSFEFTNDQIVEFVRDIKRRIATILETKRYFPNPSRFTCSICPYCNDKSLCKHSRY